MIRMIGRRHFCLGVLLLLLLVARGRAQSGGQVHAPTSFSDAKALALALIDAPDNEARRALVDANASLKTKDLVGAYFEVSNGRQSPGGPAGARAASVFIQQLSHELEFPKGEILATIGLGIIEGKQAKYDEAMVLFEQARRDALAEQLPMLAVQTLANMGIVHRRRGDFDLALTCYQEALAVYDSQPTDTPGKSDVLNNLGTLASDQGRYGLAMEYHRRALAIRQQLKMPAFEVAGSLVNIGGVYDSQGETDLAHDYYLQALAAFGGTQDDERLAVILNNLGHVSVERGRYDDARTYLQRCLDIARSANNRWQEVAVHENLGQVLVAQKQYAPAIDEFRLSISQAEQLGFRLGALDSLLDLAGAQLASERPAEARESADRAFALATELARQSSVWRSQALRGAAAVALGDKGGAERAFRSSLDAIDKFRHQVAGGAAQRERAFESMQDPYHGLLDVLVEAQRFDEALAVAERAKARVLFEEVAGDSPRIGRTMSDAERARDRELRRPIAMLSAELTASLRSRAKPDPARIASLVTRRDAALRALDDFEATLYVTHPELRTRSGDVPVLSAADLADLLPTPRSAAVEFEVMADHTVAFVMRRKPVGDAGGSGVVVSAYVVPVKRSVIDAQARAFRTAVAARDLSVKASARRLFDTVLAPAATALAGVSDLLVVPDGSLWEAPFQALALPDGTWLAEHMSVSVAPSLSVLRAISRTGARRATAPPSLAALVVGSAGNGAGAGTGAAALPTLAEAEGQARAIAGIYGAARSKVVIGPDARPDRVVAEAGRARIVHVSAHGILNDASPLHSYLQLFRKAGDPIDGGRLEAGDLMDVKLAADLVVLSACETGRGRVGAGEGLMGLSWALFVAGTPSAVVSQWKVDALSTTALMTEFHRELNARLVRDGEVRGRAESLRLAALKLMRGGAYAHPFYWAPFVVMGNGN